MQIFHLTHQPPPTTMMTSQDILTFILLNPCIVEEVVCCQTDKDDNAKPTPKTQRKVHHGKAPKHDMKSDYGRHPSREHHKCANKSFKMLR